MCIIFALLAAISVWIVVVLSKAGMKNLDSSLVFAIEAVLIILISWSVVLFQGKYVEIIKIDSRIWIYIIGAGIMTTLFSLFSFRALKLGEAAAVSPLQTLSLVFAIIFAGLFLKERITWQVIAGAALMVTGAIIIAIAKKAS